MRTIKCFDCGKKAEQLECNSCSTKISVCPEHRKEYFPIDTENEFVCIDCVNAGAGGIKRWIASH